MLVVGNLAMPTDTKTFPKVLDPQDTSSGGGSASAIAGAMAGSLIAMVCGVSSKGATDDEGILLHTTATRAQELSNLLLEGSRNDAVAFQAVRTAYRLPKDSDDERKTRNRAIQEAWATAAQIPLDNAKCCLDVARLGAELPGHIGPNLTSDLTCALLLAQAGGLGCLENVAVNLPSIRNPEVVARLDQEARRVRDQLAEVAVLPTSWQPTDDTKRKAETR